MKKTLKALVAFSVAVLGAIALPTAASADSGFSADPQTMHSGCRNYAYDYWFSLPSNVTSWDLDISIYGPDGSSSTGDYAYGDGSTATGSEDALLCSYEGAGSYHIEGTLTGYDEDYDEVVTESPQGVLVMQKMPSRTTLKVRNRRPRFNQAVALTIKSQRRDAYGWVRHRYEYVALEVKTKKGWKRLPGSKSSTSRSGKTTLKYRWNVRRTLKLRGVTLANQNVKLSKSKVQVIKPRGGSKRPQATTRPVSPLP